MVGCRSPGWRSSCYRCPIRIRSTWNNGRAVPATRGCLIADGVRLAQGSDLDGAGATIDERTGL